MTQHITPSELKRAKAQARADLLMGQESVQRRAEILGHQMLNFGKPQSTQSILDQVMAVTEEETRAMAEKILSRKPILTALGPHDQLEDYRQVVARLAE